MGDNLAILDFFAKICGRRRVVLQEKLQAEEEHRKKVLKHLEGLEKIAIAIDNRQKEMVIQLEELDASVNEGSGGHFEPLMTLSDIIYDFFCYSKKDAAIAEQARMMWHGTTQSLKKAGLEVLEPTGETFNHCLHVAHGIISDPGTPHETVSETLKCGYVFGDRILRRATVVVNKMNGGSQT